AFFGDGATNIGTFHESLNLAQLWQVPAVFVLEDNHWAESTPESQHSPIRDLSKRAEAFGMKVMKVDGQDVEEVHRVAQRALKHARDGKGPVFLHVETERLVGHYIGDPQVYRDKEELRRLQETRDPIKLFREKHGISDEDFLTVSMEQIVNQAAKHRYMSGGQLKVPLTIRTQGGAGWSPGAQHAQQVEAWFVHVPGLKVVFASTPTDVRGLLWSAIYDENPVIFFEHRTLYGLKEEVPDELEPIPIGQGRVHREGSDVTVVATGRL